MEKDKDPKYLASAAQCDDLETDQDELVVEKAIGLSILEIALGSILHGFKVPFSGHALSLNQGLYLIKSTHHYQQKAQAAKVAFEISSIVAIMKSFSPAGKKFGPMISISSQGFLYSLGVYLFGNNIIGRSIGISLLSLWAFIQPFITYSLIYGADFTKALSYFIKKLNKHTPVSQENLISIVITIIAVKITLALILSFYSKNISTGYLSKIIYRFEKKPILKRKKHRNASIGAANDLLRPFFIISLVFMIFFFVLSGHSYATIFWKVLRSIGIAYIIFFISRSESVYTFFVKVSHKNKFIESLFSKSRSAYKKIMD